VPGKRADGVNMRGIPVHDDLWKAAMAKAKAEGTSLYELIRQFLREYVAK
jgi:predicted HicB family RNase H-like nuclease